MADEMVKKSTILLIETKEVVKYLRTKIVRIDDDTGEEIVIFYNEKEYLEEYELPERRRPIVEAHKDYWFNQHQDIYVCPKCKIERLMHKDWRKTKLVCTDCKEMPPCTLRRLTKEEW